MLLLLLLFGCCCDVEKYPSEADDDDVGSLNAPEMNRSSICSMQLLRQFYEMYYIKIKMETKTN